MQSITDSFLLQAAVAAVACSTPNNKLINSSSKFVCSKTTSNTQHLHLNSPSNAFSSRPPSTPSPSLSLNNINCSANNSITKPLKCILPPVSQEQFDRYANINTEDLVRKVKDLLSKFSISQRLFGECILGLSQGSVSDLLARPKPWQMLTQKGREPFIRMQMFIDDPDAIKKLMTNQYRTTDNTSTLGKIQLNNSFKSSSSPTSSNLGSNNSNTSPNNVNNSLDSFAFSSLNNNSNKISYYHLPGNQSGGDNSNDSELKQHVG
jgi:hypothetical protein